MSSRNQLERIESKRRSLQEKIEEAERKRDAAVERVRGIEIKYENASMEESSKYEKLLESANNQLNVAATNLTELRQELARLPPQVSIPTGTKRI